jgi:hypothetical protein
MVAATLPGISPAAPTALSARANGSQIGLTWGATQDNVAGEIAGYTIYRGTSSGLEAAYANISARAGTAYNDANVTPGVTYFYRVAAQNGFGIGERSTGASSVVSKQLPPASSSDSNSSTNGTVATHDGPIVISGGQGGFLGLATILVGMTAAAATTVVFSFSRSGFSKKKSVVESVTLEEDHTIDPKAPTEQPVVELKAGKAIELPAMSQEISSNQVANDSVQMEFENALEELASMARIY